MSAAYKPEEIKLFTAVLDCACEQTSAHNRIDRAIIAMRILYAAGKGERDPERLLARAIAA
jgi:hypothetical protein